MKITLWQSEIPFFCAEADTPNEMTAYFLDTDRPLPCVVVLPGGGYHMRAPHEGGPIAQFFNSRGIHAAVLEYRVAPNRFPSGLADVQRGIRILRAHAEEWKIDPDRILICGFSAGGHLAASSLLWEDVLPADWTPEALDSLDFRPNGGILCYPVISVGAEYGHVGSGKNLLGEEAYSAEHSRFSLEQYITEQTPPVFLWHTSDDASVNVKNSLTFGEKLRDHGVPFEMHIYPHGKHGLGLASEHSDVSGWANAAAAWILKNFPAKEA